MTALAALVLSAASMTITATASMADSGGGTCSQYGPGGICIVWVGSGGGSGSGGGAGGGGSGSGGSGGGGACQWGTSSGHAPGVVPCTTASGAVWNGYCYLQLAAPQPPKGVDGGGVWGGHTDGAIYICAAAGPGESPAGIVGLEWWFATPPPGLGPSPAQLAQQALATLTIPTPTPGRYPAGTLPDGRAYTVVSAYTWFWSDPAAFRPLTATAAADGVSVTVMVSPAALTFTPGDGSLTVSCAGPGTAWNSSDGVWAASPSGCDYRYPQSSIHDAGGEVTATYGIVWAIAWTSSVGDHSTLPALTTTAQSSFAVAEVESVVTH